MNTLIASCMFCIMGQIIPQNTVRMAIDTAVKEARAYTDSKIKTTRSSGDLTIYEPMNEHWEWTSDDPACPTDFLPYMNSYDAPKPHIIYDHTGAPHWAGAVMYNLDGSVRYECYLRGGSPSDTKVTFEFFIPGGPEVPSFNATATRKSATDTTPVPVNGTVQVAVAGEPVMPYASKKRLSTYLYEMQYDTYNIEEAKAYFLSQFVPPTNKLNSTTRLRGVRRMGGCSGLRSGNFFGRNFDWMYDDDVTVVIRVPEDNTIGRQASLGVCYAAGLSEDVLKSDTYNPLFRILPYHTVDGVNESGVYIQDNVCPPGDYGYTISTHDGAKHRVAGMMVVRYVLDYATNAVHACELIKNDLDIYGFYSGSVSDELHYLIADANNTFIVESISNRIEVVNVAERPIITNFHIWNTSINGSSVDMSTVTPHANGIERYNILYGIKDTANSLTGMMNAMKTVEYTKTYSSDPFWYSELYGDNYTKDTPVEEFATIKKYMLDAFAARNRKVPYLGFIWTWQTCHTSVYDLANRMLWLVDQERDPSTGSYFVLHPERKCPINY